jgi:hypothetical protein
MVFTLLKRSFLVQVNVFFFCFHSVQSKQINLFRSKEIPYFAALLKLNP